MEMSEARVDDMLANIKAEYRRARQMHNPMRGSHEGWAVIYEEVDEMWDEIKASNIHLARSEAVQVAAMCLAFLLEVNDVAG